MVNQVMVATLKLMTKLTTVNPWFSSFPNPNPNRYGIFNKSYLVVSSTPSYCDARYRTFYLTANKDMFYNKNKPVDKTSFSDVLIVDPSSAFGSVIRSSRIDIYNILTFGSH